MIAKEKIQVNTVDQEKRFDRGAWLVVASMLLFAVVVIIPTLYILRMPGDGWQSVYQQPPLNDFVGDWPTTLQEGDIVLAVDGVSLVYGDLEISPLLPAPPSWQQGSTVTYRIERAGQEQNVDVTLHILSVWGVLKAVSNTALADLPLLSWFIIGLLVFILRPGSTPARLFFIAGATLAFGTRIGWAAETVSAYFAPPAIWVLQRYIHSFWEMIFFPSMIVLLLVFPKPLWTPARFPRLILALFFLIPLVSWIMNVVTGQVIFTAITLAAEAVIILALAIAAVVQAYRNRQDRVLMAQVSWVALGIAISVGGSVVTYLLDRAGLMDQDNLFGTILNWAIFLALPISMAIAILRYRLFDIQIIIRKTLVYTIVTALLALIYFGLVIVLQAVFDSIIGQQSPIIIVLSTLTIAALFAPFRNRVQKLIDRRFFRNNYNADQALAQFAQLVQNETNVEEVRVELMRVIQDTMEPEQISISLLKLGTEGEVAPP